MITAVTDPSSTDLYVVGIFLLVIACLPLASALKGVWKDGV